MRKLRAWFWRKMAHAVEHYFGVVLVEYESFNRVVGTARDLDAFCQRSGFLTTVNHGAGRHAQRKIRRRAFDISMGLRAGAVGPWRT